MKYLAFIAILLSGICVADDAISVDDLINNPEKYNEKIVTVTGVIHLEFEGDELQGKYHKIWLDLFNRPYTDESVAKDRERINKYSQLFQDKEVVLTGQFSTKETGIWGLWPGGIVNVTEIHAK